MSLVGAILFSYVLVVVTAVMTDIFGPSQPGPMGIPRYVWEVAVLGVIVTASVAVAWKWELVGGILLITEGLFPILNLIFATERQGGFRALVEFAFVASALLVLGGVLFIISWWKGRFSSITSSTSPLRKRGTEGVM